MLHSKTLAENVTAICKERKINIGEFEKGIGKALGYFSRVKREDCSIRFDDAYEISKKLGVDLKDLADPKYKN